MYTGLAKTLLGLKETPDKWLTLVPINISDTLFLLQRSEPIQARLEYIKGRFIGKLLSGEFTGPKDWGQRSHHWDRRRGRGRERECVQGEEKETGWEKPKCLDYIGRILWRKGSPAPRLKSSGFGAGHSRQELRDAGRTWRPGLLWCVKYALQSPVLGSKTKQYV